MSVSGGVGVSNSEGVGGGKMKMRIERGIDDTINLLNENTMEVLQAL